MAVDPTLSAQPNMAAMDASAAQVMGQMPGPTGPTVPQGGRGIINTLLQWHQAKQNQGLTEIAKYLQASFAGFPIKPEALAKSARKAGLPLDTSPEGLAAHQADHQGQQAPSPLSPGQPTSHGSSPTTAQAQPTAQPTAQNLAGVQKGVTSKKQQQQMAALAWATQALQAAHERGESERGMIDLQHRVEQAHRDALSEDPGTRQRAIGQLMSLGTKEGGIPFDKEQLMLAGMTPEQMGSMMNIFAGGESPTQHNARVDSMAQNLQSSGRYTDPEAAMAAARALASGQPIPDAVKSKQKPFTMAELTEQAAMMSTLSTMGIPGDKLQSVFDAASSGGLGNAMPTGFQTAFQKEYSMKQDELGLRRQEVGIQAGQLEVQRGQLGVEQQRTAIDYYNAQVTAAKLAEAEARDENKALFDNIRALVDMKRQGKIDVPDEVVRSYEKQLGQAAGLDVTEVDTWLTKVTGGFLGQKKLVFTPRPASALAGAAAGKTPEQKKKETQTRRDAGETN